MNTPARQSPQQETVDRPECEFAGLCPLADPRYVIEYPGDLGCRKIRIQLQAGFRGHHRFGAGFSQRVAGQGRTAILPDDRVMHAPAGLTVPDQRGLALIGDANAGKICGGRAGV